MKTFSTLTLALLMTALAFADHHGGGKEAKHVWKAIEDFKPVEDAKVLYYVDKKQKALAINAAIIEYRTGFARAELSFAGEKGSYNLTLVTLGEIDGDSSYKVSVNGDTIGTFQNNPVETDYSKITFKMPDVMLKPGDVIAVESNAHTNGKIPEGDGTAWSRGRWVALKAH